MASVAGRRSGHRRGGRGRGRRLRRGGRGRRSGGVGLRGLGGCAGLLEALHTILELDGVLVGLLTTTDARRDAGDADGDEEDHSEGSTVVVALVGAGDDLRQSEEDCREHEQRAEERQHAEAFPDRRALLELGDVLVVTVQTVLVITEEHAVALDVGTVGLDRRLNGGQIGAHLLHDLDEALDVESHLADGFGLLGVDGLDERLESVLGDPQFLRDDALDDHGQDVAVSPVEGFQLILDAGADLVETGGLQVTEHGLVDPQLVGDLADLVDRAARDGVLEGGLLRQRGDGGEAVFVSLEEFSQTQNDD